MKGSMVKAGVHGGQKETNDDRLPITVTRSDLRLRPLYCQHCSKLSVIRLAVG